ncbi:helix-turn-helix transcriptional regulator [Phenylobacterium sp.]|uniref:helix-turn-helix transcriptional regulator n=1 Tax=Phenylobacterium sp. TaxID=1871053 RepID=UPI003002F906
MSGGVEDGTEDVGGRDDRLLDWPQVARIASISRSTAWRMERDGAFPRRVRVSPGRVGWWESELTRWKRSRGAETPPPPPRKPARTPQLPGTARPMPAPGASAPPPRAAKPRRRGSKTPSAQMDFGF